MTTLPPHHQDSNPSSSQKFLPFEEARAYVRLLGIGNQKEWYTYCRSGMRPNNIPATPERVYKDQWLGVGDWLGTGVVHRGKRKRLPFEEARTFVHTLGLKNYHEWAAYCISGQKPDDIPSDPYKVYKLQFQGLGDWLGTGTIAPQYREYLPFEEARVYIHHLKLKSVQEWEDYCRSGQKPETIPSAPWNTYKAQWQGYGDWLGTGRLATFDTRYVRVSREHTRERMRLYYRSERQRELGRIKTHRHRMRKRAIPGTLTHEQVLQKLKLQRFRCYYCFVKFKRRNGRYVYHLEHTIPSSRTEMQPRHDMSYVVLSCRHCNLVKNNKLPHEWEGSGRLF